MTTAYELVKIDQNNIISTVFPSAPKLPWISVNENEDITISDISLGTITKYINTFNCRKGFYGEYCDITNCYGIFSNHSKSCSGVGHCSSYGTCNCAMFGYGTNCERRTITCNPPNNSPSLAFCNNRGLCNEGTNCLCLSGNFNDRGQGKSVIKIGEGSTYTGTILQSEDKSCSFIQETYQFVYKCGKKVTWSFSYLNYPTAFLQSDGSLVFKQGSGTYNQNPFETNALVSVNGKYIVAGNDGSIRMVDGIGKLLFYSNTSISGKLDTTFGGSDCSNSDCYGYNKEEPFVCSGHGKCVGYNNCNCKSGYSGLDCSIYSCFNISSTNDSVCSGNGVCSDLNTCECDINHTGIDCSLHVCFGTVFSSANVCSGKGICSSANNCTCDTNYCGDECQVNCQSLVCNGKLGTDSSVCSSNGKCIDAVCICNNDSYGNDCQYLKCNGKTIEDVTVCSSSGTCMNGTCNCNSSTYGNDCQYLKCNGKLADDPGVCSSRGICLSGLCDCHQNYTGIDCEYHTCYGNSSMSKKSCSGNGKCVAVNTCACNSGFLGENCDQVIELKSLCFGISKFDMSTCSGNGYCVGENNCSCKAGYYGEMCNISDCFGHYSNSSLVCSTHGSCSSLNHCVCYEGYTGPICNNSICFGISSNDSSVCSNSNGYCKSPNFCECKLGYGGIECELPLCFEKLSNDSQVCNGHGFCSSPNVCKCSSSLFNVKFDGFQCENIKCLGENNSFIAKTDPTVCNSKGACEKNGCHCENGFSGYNCQLYTCNGILFNESNVCDGHGECISYNTCKCFENIKDGYWKGNTCSECRPDYTSVMTGCKKPSCDPLFTCNGNGICDSNQECVCNGTWEGKYCSDCKVNYYGSGCAQYCEKTVTCSGHGECSEANGNCICESSIEKGFWKGSNCNLCEDDYYGSKCTTQIMGPAKFLNNYSGIVFKLFGPISYISQQVNCQDLILNSQFSLFGSKPTCLWTNRLIGEFTIQFGVDYTLSPNSKVKFNRLIFDNDIDGLEYTELTIKNADNPYPPTIVLSGKTSLGSCDSFTLDASKSFSYEGKPLTYYWVVLKSPNNSLSLHGNSSVIEIDYPILKYAGEYKIGVQVESVISGKNSEMSVWTFTKSEIPLPTLSIVGSKELTIFKYESPIVIKQILYTPPCFYLDQTLDVLWQQLSGPQTTTQVDKFNNLAITNFSAFNASIYEFKVSATSTVNPLSISYDIIKIQVKPSPLSLTVYSDEITSESGTIFVNMIDPDDTSETELWSWTCLDLTNNKGCGTFIDNSLLLASDQKQETFDISASDFNSVQIPILKLTLRVQKGMRYVESSMEFLFLEKETNKIAPTISLISVFPTSSLILKSQILNLQLQVTANGQSIGIDEYITREWTLNSKILQSGDSILYRTADITKSNTIVIDPYTIDDTISPHKLTLRVTDLRNQLNATFTHQFTIASPPKACPCNISPSSGIALETNFIFSCSNCQNSQQTLQVIYGYYDKSEVSIELYDQGGAFSSKLPSSPHTNKVITFFKIIDKSTGAFTEIKQSVTVEIPFVKSVIEIKKKVSSWTAIQNSLKDGDPAKLIFNSATISIVSSAMLEMLAASGRRNIWQDENKITCKNGGIWREDLGKCNCVSGFAKIDCSLSQQDFEVYQDIRIGLMKLFVESFDSRNPFEMMTEASLSIHALSLDSLLENFDEVDSYCIENSLRIMKSLLTPTNYKYFSIPQGVDTLLIDIINSIYRYFKYHEESKASAFELLKPFSVLILRDMFIGEMDKQIKFDFAELVANKMFRPSFSSRSILSSNSSVVLPFEMPQYLNEKSNRKPISFLVILTSDVFGVESTLKDSTLIGYDKNIVNSSIITTNTTSYRYIRSQILSMELFDSATQIITNEIEYKMKYFNLQNYTEKTLTNSTRKSDSHGETVVNTYMTSQFSCHLLNNYSMIMDNQSCSLAELSSNIVSCRCNSTGRVLLVENIIETIEQLFAPKSFENSPYINETKKDNGTTLGIILGTILGFTACLLILVLTIGLFRFIGSKDSSNNNLEMNELPSV